MPKSKKRSSGGKSKKSGVTPQSPSTSVKGSTEKLDAGSRKVKKPKRKVKRGFFARFKTFRSAESFECESCGRKVHEYEYMGVMPNGFKIKKLCEWCFWNEKDASMELVGEDTRKTWVKWVHAALRPLMFLLYGVGALVVIITVLSIIQLLIFGSS